MAVTGTAHGTGQHNWRRYFFFAVEIIFAVIAATGEGFMYAAYLPAGPERWPEAIARATITQFIIILFGVAAIEALRIRNLFMRSVTMLAAWGVTLGASLITFWFLLDAAQVFRDTAMLAPLKDATITLPNGAVIANSTIDIVLVAALPFFQTALNILAPIITADHAPETLEQQRERQARELADARHKAEKRAMQAQGVGAMLGGGFRAVKQAASGEQSGETSGGNDDEEAAATVTPLRLVGDDASGGFGSPAPQSQPGAKGIRKGQWTTSDLRAYALATYGANVSKEAAQDAMSALFTLGKARKVGNRYVASERTVRAWVDGKYGDGKATGTGER